VRSLSHDSGRNRTGMKDRRGHSAPLRLHTCWKNCD